MRDSALFTTSSARDKHVEGFSPIEKHKVWCRKDQCSVVMKSLSRCLAVLKSNKRWFSRAQKAEEFGGPRSKALLGSVEKKPNASAMLKIVKAAVLKKPWAWFSPANKLQSVSSDVLKTSSAPP